MANPNQHSIVWTVLPNGTVSSSPTAALKVSLFVSLRLASAGGGLNASFNWPQRVNALTGVQVEFQNDAGMAVGSPVALTLDKSQLSLGSGSLWNQTFPGGSTVRAYPEEKIAELVARPKVSYPIRPIRETVHTLYGHIAEHFPTTPPPMFEGYSNYEYDPGNDPPFPALSRFLVDMGRDIVFFEGIEPGSDIMLSSTPGTLNGHPGLDQLGPTSPFYRAYRFYRREIDNNRFPEDAVPPPTLKEPDVHEAIGMLGDHPFLLRRYGLIIDATFSAVPAGATRIRLVQTALPTSDPAGVVITNRTPWTAFTRESNAFLPAPANPTESDQRLGFLKLGDVARYEFQQLDVDGIALKLGNYASTLIESTETVRVEDNNNQRIGGNFPLRTAEDQRLELPNVRTGGFTLGRLARSELMDLQFARSEELNSGASDVLFAEDVTRGYRVDAFDSSERTPVWRSLVRRKGSFLIGESRQRVPASGNIQDEGYVKGSSATSEPGPDQTTADAPLYVHEALATWDGWSLVIKAPGRAQVFEEGEGDQVVRVENTPATAFKVEPQFQVDPGSLPRLRFGHLYRLRARTVDLAGNSLPLSATSTDATLATEQQIFKRYEPVSQPVLVLRNPIVEGESVEHIVIRSKSGNARLPGNLFFNRNERHVAPPNTTVEMVIRHGMLDRFFDDPTRSFNIAQKSEGTFLDREIWDTRTGRKIPVPGIQIINPPLPPGEVDNRPPPEFPARGDGLEPGQYVIHKNERLLLPYLPDPLAVGVAVIDAPEVPRDPSTDPVLEDPRPLVGLQKIFFRDHWPNVEPFRIIVQATNASMPSARVEGGNLVVRLPPATMLPLRYSSLIKREALLEQMAVWSLMTPEAQANADLLQIAVDGQHWMITPNRDLVAVHAVERPLRAAKFAPDTLVVDPPRLIGETFVRLACVVDNHSRSTGRIDIEATWTDPVDRLTEPGPTEETNTGHVSNHQPQYGDSLMNVPLLPTFSPDETEIPKQDFSDTKHRYVDYRPDATTRYREYFPASVAADPANISIRGIETQVNVLSSARPNIPLVLYIVPTFKWETDRHTKTSRRIGRGLRVYLSRSWFSSGIDELLGVVLPILNTDGGLRNPGPTTVTEATENPDSLDPNLERVRRYISQWGDDPIWTGTGPSQHLVAANFGNAVATNDVELNLAEDEAFPFSATTDTRARVNVAAFPVEFNRDRQVWFADIEMQPADSYFPFVRLALARFQPHSVTQTFPNSFTTNVHLSRVIRTEFAQLVNDRSATVTPNMDTLTVTVVGLAARNKLGVDIVAAMLPPMDPAPAGPPGFVYDPAAGAGRVVMVHVERRDEGDSDLEWEQVGASVILPSFSPSGPMASPETLWTGEVPRPSRQQQRRFDYRLVIREIEVFDSDQDVAETVPIAIPPERDSPRGPEPRFARGRVVYLDTIGLDDAERHGHGHR